MKIYFIENRFILFEYQNMFLLIQKKSVFNKICFHYKFFYQNIFIFNQCNYLRILCNQSSVNRGYRQIMVTENAENMKCLSISYDFA